MEPCPLAVNNVAFLVPSALAVHNVALLVQFSSVRVCYSKFGVTPRPLASQIARCRHYYTSC